MRITVVNAIGVEVARVFNGQASKGDNQYIFNGKELEPGLYNYIISGENFEAQEKIVLIK